MEVVHEPPRPRVALRWVVPALVVALLVVGVPLWVWLRGSDGAGSDVGGGPSAPAHAGDPGQHDDAPPRAADQQIAEIAEQIAEVRQLALQRPVDARFLPVSALVDRIEELTADQEGATGSLQTRGRLLETLGMVPAGTDVAGSLRTLYDETVFGIYVPGEQRLYVNQSAPLTAPWTRWASAHEVAHALQDQHFDFASLLDFGAGALDQELAGLSLVEGDAVVTQVTWAQRFLTSDERSQLGEGPDPIGASPDNALPPYLLARFTFPYEAGAEFVAALLAEGGLDAVDAALRRPPTTSAQILHPQRYLHGVEAAAVAVTADPGDGWRPERRDQFGEFDLRWLLDPLGVEEAHDLAAGWAGGQARSWTRGSETAVAVGLVLGTDHDARALCAALPEWWRRTADGTVREQAVGEVGVGRSPEGWLAYRCAGTRVDVARAPDQHTVRALTGAD